MNVPIRAILGAACLLLTPIRTARAGDPPAPHGAGIIGRRIQNAAPGDTIVVSAGTYHEHLVIEKPLTLVGEGLPTIDGGGDGDIIQIRSPHVTVRGFRLRGTGISLDLENCAIRVQAAHTDLIGNDVQDALFGIDLKEAPDCTLRGNRVGGKALDIARRGDGIRLWRSDRCLIEDNVIHDGRDSILWYSSDVVVRRNDAFNCRYGFHLMYSDNVRIEDNRLADNSVGVYLMYSHGLSLVRNRLIRNRGPSGYGLGLKDTENFTVAENLFLGNRVGIYIDAAPYSPGIRAEFLRNTIACNDIGVTFLPSVKHVVLSENSFLDNIEQVGISGRGRIEENQFERDGRGNFWSDYAGYDLDHDGIGDFPYEATRLFESLLDKHPNLRLLLFSPAQQAVEFVARAVPAVQPEPKFVDEHPLTTPVGPPDLAADPPRSAAMGVGAAGLLALGSAVVLAARVSSLAPLVHARNRRRLNPGAP